MILRLTQRYCGSGQIVIANKQCICFSEEIGTLRARGLYFMGIVKTALKCYPKEFLSNWSARERSMLQPSSTEINV